MSIKISAGFFRFVFVFFLFQIMVTSRYKTNGCEYERELPHYMSCVEENIFTSIYFHATIQAAAY